MRSPGCQLQPGPYCNPPPGHDWSLAGLLSKMDELGIAEACPTATMGCDYDASSFCLKEWDRLFALLSERKSPVLYHGAVSEGMICSWLEVPFVCAHGVGSAETVGMSWM